MRVKVRKVGNSYTVSVPVEAVRQLDIRDGQFLDVLISGRGLEYRICDPLPDEIDWDKYAAKGEDLRGGLSPDEYVRSIRDEDREDIF